MGGNRQRTGCTEHLHGARYTSQETLVEPPSKRWEADGRARWTNEAEWRAITDKLVETACAHLEDRQSLAVQEASQVYADVVEVFKEQNRVRLERARALIDSEKKPDSSELQRSRDTKTAELKTRFPIWAAWRIAWTRSIVACAEKIERPSEAAVVLLTV